MTFHHIGFIVKDLDSFEKSMIYEDKVKDVVDHIQNARLSLYTNFNGGFLELIQPLSETAYTWEVMEQKGNHFHHLCYLVSNTDELTKVVEKQRLIEVLKPVPAILFDNKKVCFYYTRNKQLVEFLINE